MLSTSTARPMAPHEDYADIVPPAEAGNAPDLPLTQADFENHTLNNASNFEIIDFRQPPLKDHLAKIQIFTMLCDVLCDSNPATTSAREELYEYATKYLLEHLLDIDPTRTTGNQSKLVVEALSRLLSIENEACRIFEAMQKDIWYINSPLYEYEPNYKRISLWARKMSFHEDEELNDVAHNWVENTIKDPSKIFAHLARGHIINLSQTLDMEKAKISFMLAYQALCTVSQKQSA
jgi:hypothetical protein